MMKFSKLVPLSLLILSVCTAHLFSSNIGRSVYGVYSETYPGFVFDVENSTVPGHLGTPDGGMIGAWVARGFYDRSYISLTAGGKDAFWKDWSINYSSQNAVLFFDNTVSSEGSECLRFIGDCYYGPWPWFSSSTWHTGAGQDTRRNVKWWIQFGSSSYTTPPNAQVPTDMSAYLGGSLDFMVKTSTEMHIFVGWRDPLGYDTSYYLKLHEDLGVPLQDFVHISTNILNQWVADHGLDYAYYGWDCNPLYYTLGNQDHGFATANDPWHHLSIPLSSFTGINLSSITVLVGFGLIPQSTHGMLWVDDIKWMKPASSGTITVNIRNVSNGALASDIAWSGITLGSTKWKIADQYLEIDCDYYENLWGIQIYTDNTSSLANPRFIGVKGSTINPVGLLGYDPAVESTASMRIPMCWRITDNTTNTFNIKQSSATLYEVTFGSAYPCFVWMKDKATPSIPWENTTQFTQGEDYVTVWDSRGIQHAENTWGTVPPSKNYIYLGANFEYALTPRRYRTNRLVVELFHE